jgi:serine/threonine-protein kinase
MRATSRPRVQTIGRYRLESVLGQGAMATVYRARDGASGRVVALKVMEGAPGDGPELKARFLREAEAAGRLHHRNVAAVYEVGEEGGRPFIAMEYVEGTDLATALRERATLSLEWKLDVLRQICEGLDCAHAHGVVHRDLKPENVRLRPDGEVKIVDFGMARLASTKLTQQGALLGTVHYMSPEQVEGREVDARSDVFAVGVVAYELFAGRKPFDGESPTQVLYRIVHEPADMSLIPSTPYSPGLEAIVARALAKAPADRYPGMAALRDSLEALVRDAAARLGPGTEP